MESRNVWRIPPYDFDGSPALTLPAGYICFLRDVSYGNRYQIRLVGEPEELSRHLSQAFEVEVALVFQADDARQVGRELLEYVGGTSAGEWFDLADDRFDSLLDLGQRSTLSSLLEGSGPRTARPRSTSHRHVNRAAASPSRRQARPARQRSTAHRTTNRATAPPAPEGSVRADRPRRRNRGWKLLFIILIPMIVAGLYGAITERDPVADLLVLAETARAITVNSEPTATVTDPPSTARGTGRRSASPTPTVEGRGEVFYTTTRANVRACARLSCKTLAVLNRGARIVAQRYVKGQRWNGSDRWIEFGFRGQEASIHSRVLTRDRPETTPLPTATATDPPPPTATLTATSTATSTATDPPPTATATSTATDPPPTATATDPPPTSTATSTATLTATSTATDPPPTATATSTATDPPPTATATEPPPTATATSTATSTATATELPPTATISSRYVIETQRNLNANVRACPRTSCDIVDKLLPGTEVEVVGRVRGETVYATAIWLEIRLAGGSGFIHSELVAEAG